MAIKNTKEFRIGSQGKGHLSNKRLGSYVLTQTLLDVSSMI